MAWYYQAGTPTLAVETSYDPATQTFHLTCAQHLPPTPKCPHPAPMLIPLALGLVDPAGGGDLLLEGYSTPGAPPVSLRGSDGTCPTTVILLLLLS